MSATQRIYRPGATLSGVRLSDLRDQLGRLVTPPVLAAERVGWIVVPLVLGRPVDAALDDVSDPVRWTASVGLWVAWLVGVLALLVPHPVALTALRIVAPATIVVATAAAVGGEADPVGIALSLAVAAGSLSAPIGEIMVQGAAYGDEARLPLRPPVVLLAGPIPLVWAVVVAGITSGPLLLAARQWVAGAVVTAVGLALAVFGIRALHVLSRRWLVFVPAGVVLHDPMSTADPFLCRRATMAGFGPVPAGVDLERLSSLDATRGAAGVVLAVRMNEPVQVVPLHRGGDTAEMVSTTAVTFCPTRPGRTVEEARRRRLPNDPWGDSSD